LVEAIAEAEVAVQETEAMDDTRPQDAVPDVPIGEVAVLTDSSADQPAEDQPTEAASTVPSVNGDRTVKEGAEIAIADESSERMQTRNEY
jgi:hypothetical protein